jgi:hypothetical protein
MEILEYTPRLRDLSGKAAVILDVIPRRKRLSLKEEGISDKVFKRIMAKLMIPYRNGFTIKSGLLYFYFQMISVFWEKPKVQMSFWHTIAAEK